MTEYDKTLGLVGALKNPTDLHESLMVMRVTPDSALVDKSLKESRLGDALGSRVLGILRGDEPIVMPEPDELIRPDDRLVVEGESVADVNQGLRRRGHRVEVSRSPTAVQMIVVKDGVRQGASDPRKGGAPAAQSP